MILEGMYLNGETAKDGEIIKFETEGEETTIGQGKDSRPVINFHVTRTSDNKTFIYTPNWGAIKVFKQAWGNDTKAWVGKLFKCDIVLMKIGNNKINVIEPVPFVTEDKLKTVKEEFGL